MGKVSFLSDVNPVDFRIAVITGVCRSGKTTLGNLLATSKHVEHADEPWTPLMLPIMSGVGSIRVNVAKDMFVAAVSELFNEMVHLRNANFRPNDLSSIYQQKDIREIFARFNSINSRHDVKKYIKKNNPLCLLNLAETSPFINFLLDSVQGSKIIFVVRKGEDVANDCFKKRWFSEEQLKKPLNRVLYREFQKKRVKWYLPWWVSSGDEEFFIMLNEYDRCIYYWNKIMKETLSSFDIMKSEKDPVVKTIIYEKFVSDPMSTYDIISEFLRIEPTQMTQIALSNIKKYKIEKSTAKIIKDPYLEKELHEIYDNFGFI